MLTLYEPNGLVFWSEKEIRLRRQMEEYFVSSLVECLKAQNRAFDFFQCEASLLTPRELINPNYTDDDIFAPTENLVLRPETTMGSYAYARYLLNTHNDRKVRMPFVVWQHGKSFRNEQDQPLTKMRLKEFYQLEFQILFDLKTANDYSLAVVPTVREMIENFIGECRIENSDRLPDYSESTTDIVCVRSNMEVCSISKRKDFEGAKCLEVAIGTDRVLHHFPAPRSF